MGLAAVAGNQPIVELLLEYGPNLHLLSQAEKTAFDLSETRGIRRLLGKHMIEGGLSRSRTDSSEDKEAKPRKVSKQEQFLHRVRIEGLPRVFMPDVLEEQVRVMLRR